MASCVKFHFDHVQRIHRKRSLTLFQQCNINLKKLVSRCQSFAHLWLDDVPSTSGECGSVSIVGRCLSTEHWEDCNHKTSEPKWICFTNLSISGFQSKHYHTLKVPIYHFSKKINDYIYIYKYASMLTYASSTVTSHSQGLVFELTFLELWDSSCSRSGTAAASPQRKKTSFHGSRLRFES